MKTATKVGIGIGAGALALGAVLFATRKKANASSGDPISPGCVPQAPQDFLIRTNYMAQKGGLEAAIAYRTVQYGYFQGFGDPALNSTTPAKNAIETTFFGLPVTLNRKVIPSLHCIEAEIKATCGTSYQPVHLSGLRLKNSYHNNEVSNHVYGIALDVDPALNPCCGCVGHWASDPKCKIPVANIFDRMAMPECWVHVFEKYGWYWLGHDPMGDTMHFEFLGVPPEPA